MSTYSFLPWVRLGLARKIDEVDTLGAGEGAAVERPSVDIALTLGYFPVGSDTVASDTLTVEKTAKLFGPGDAVGIRKRAIIECVPAPGSTNFPPTHLPYVTFYEEDFPWRFTPAAPDGQKLRPWLVLVVLKEDEHEFVSQGERLPLLKVKASAARAVLPPPEELWAWAHVQATSQVPHAAALEELRRRDPNLALSRIVASRRLRKNTRYRACLVPAFETGRLAGLGQSVSGVLAQKPAWPVQADYAPGGAADPPSDVLLPVYHHWSFETREEGDFETLVSALQARTAGAEFGLREMDISRPGYGLDGILEEKTLSLEGALRPPLHFPDPFPDFASAAEGEYVERLEEVLDLASNLASTNGANSLPALHPFASTASGGFPDSVSDDPILVPPTYGQWHAAVERLADAPASRRWLRTLNLDPRQRVAAGSGAEIVRARDDELVERAWEQVGEVLAANQRLREAELVKQVAARMHEKHVAPLDDDRLLMFARSAHASVVDAGSGKTVRGCIADSPVPAAALSAAFRRAARPQRKGLRRAMNGDGRQATLQAGLITELNAMAVAAAAPKGTFASSVTIDQVEQAVAFATDQVAEKAAEPSHEFIRLLWEDLAARAGVLPDVADWKAELLAAATAPEVSQLVVAITGVAATAASAVVRIRAQIFHAHFEEGVKGQHYRGLLVEADAGGGRYARAVLEGDVVRYGEDVAAFRAGALAGALSDAPRTPREDLPTIASSLRQDLEPAAALALRMQHHVVIAGDAPVIATPQRVMAYPRFPEPQFEFLKRLSYDFIIPNVQGLPANTITLLETNQPFIEAFLAGMNHEMARELLWREYPTDRRGTYFDRFWDAGDSLENDPPADVQPMDSWTGDLGEHSERTNDALLVLTIRSELFRQYPRTLVYAQRAVWQSDAAGAPRRDLPRRLLEPAGVNDVKFPAFSAELEPDIGIFAFALDAEVARGKDGDAGWFFVLKERPGQPRFGADETQGAPGPLEDWNDLTYQHLAYPPETPELLRISGNTGANLVPTSNDPARPTAARWGRSSADVAYALLQAPVLYARHAAEMLPPQD